jgi:site-specific DNA-methyltransferase (adenine-specific)
MLTKFEIFLGDCLEGMYRLPESSVDLVVTSPPYNRKVKYSTYKDNRTRQDYLDWCSKWLDQVFRVLKREGSFFLNLGAQSQDPYLIFDVVARARAHFYLQNTIDWVKSIAIGEGEKAQTFGHFQPINSPRYLNGCREYVFHLTPTGNTKLDRLAIGVPYQDKSNVTRWGHTGGQDRRCRGDVWFIPYQTIKSRKKQRGDHPATFPVELALNCIKLHGKSDITMMDPFLGIGNAAMATYGAAGMVSKFIGFDVDPGYIEEACRRLQCGHTKL